jgi:hypothetical protein
MKYLYEKIYLRIAFRLQLLANAMGLLESVYVVFLF